jgi:transcriptional regulator with XRE-family HTH domain
MRFQEIRKAAGLTQAEAAAQAGVSVGSLRMWEASPGNVISRRTRAALVAFYEQLNAGKSAEQGSESNAA